MAEVPIIMLTALDDSFSRLFGIEVGADDFFTKPYDREELRARIRTITRLNRYRILSEQREDLRGLAHELVIAQEEERHRISRELHDDLGQALTAHYLNLHNLQSDISGKNKEIAEMITPLKEQVNEILESIRLLAQDLRPPALDTLGLKAAAITYCQQFEKRTGIPIEVDIKFDTQLLNDEIAITFYRILQETLTNIFKHANAKRIWFDIRTDDDNVQMTIQDNGNGFKVKASQKKGIGITGMKERMELVGGKLLVHSVSGKGTVITASVPVSILTSSPKEDE